MASAEQQRESLNIQPLVDSIPALIHTARPDGCIDYFNRPGLDYLGATLDDVTGSKWTAFVHPEDVDGIVAQWRACLVSGENFEYETRIRRANGEYRWHLVRGVPLRDEAGNIVKWYGVVTDIEDRKRAEDKIREQESELRQAGRRGGKCRSSLRQDGARPARGHPHSAQFRGCGRGAPNHRGDRERSGRREPHRAGLT
jgi:PAS domain S-box-containing protein